VADEPRGYALDAGALGAMDGRDESAKRVARVLARALDHDLDVVVPAGALAQTFYDGRKQARLSRLLGRPYVIVASLDRVAAVEIGPLRKQKNHDDVVDVHVAWLAKARDLSVVTSDPEDMAKLGVGKDRVIEV
jgi:hypothetical protein